MKLTITLTNEEFEDLLDGLDDGASYRADMIEIGEAAGETFDTTYDVRKKAAYTKLFEKLRDARQSLEQGNERANAKAEMITEIFAEIDKLYEVFDDYDEISIGSLRKDLTDLKKSIVPSELKQKPSLDSVIGGAQARAASTDAGKTTHVKDDFLK